MDVPATQQYCGGFAAYIKRIQMGPTVNKIFHGPLILFKDAVVIAAPPWKQRAGWVAALGAGITIGGQHGMEAANEFIGGSMEKRAEMLNAFIAEIVAKYGAPTFRSEQLVAELGEWAYVIPNADITKVTLQSKGIIDKRLMIQLYRKGHPPYPTEANPSLKSGAVEALTLAFGDRLVPG